MSFQEKNAYAALAKTILIFGYFAFRMVQFHLDGRLAGPEAASLVGKSFLVLMAAAIVAYIVLTILFDIGFAIAQKDPKPDFTVDERDRLIELKGMRAFLAIFVMGFVASMAALALGATPVAALLAMIFAMFLGALADDIAKLYHYRRGF
ncbi:MAG TPA: hypothetical protein ENJ26_01275 [Rhodobacteraceae bacterium]|nr:hypothetical protein [Paracoccaceae bacterium]